MNPNRSHHSALTEIESRISILERRLRNAKSARDSYVDYLRGKYPAWKPSLPTYHKKMTRDENLVSYLATSSYHWEGNKAPLQRPPPPPPRFYSDIPRRGPFLESDFSRTRERLSLMSQQLRVLRDARMNMSTEEYFRTRAARMREDYYEEEEIPSLEGVRKRLADMSFSLVEPPSTPTMERIEEMQRAEAREKLIQDIRNGVLPSLVAEKIEEKTSSEPVKVEETKFKQDEPKPVQANETAVAPPRIQFADSKVPALAATATPVAQPAPVPVLSGLSSAKKEPEPAPSNAYQRILGLLSKKDSEDSDDINFDLPVQKATTSTPQIRNTEPQPVLGSLSQYLNKSSTIKAAPVFAAYTGGDSKKKDDSDSDDFFD